jgi:hypothetical protein
LLLKLIEDGGISELPRKALLVALFALLYESSQLKLLTEHHIFVVACIFSNAVFPKFDSPKIRRGCTISPYNNQHDTPKLIKKKKKRGLEKFFTFCRFFNFVQYALEARAFAAKPPVCAFMQILNIFP